MMNPFYAKTRSTDKQLVAQRLFLRNICTGTVRDSPLLGATSISAFGKRPVALDDTSIVIDLCAAIDVMAVFEWAMSAPSVEKPAHSQEGTDYPMINSVGPRLAEMSLRRAGGGQIARNRRALCRRCLSRPDRLTARR